MRNPPALEWSSLTFPYEHSVHVEVRGRVKGSPLLRISPLIVRWVEGSPRFIAVLTPRLPFSESSAGPPITSLRPGGVYCTKRLGRWLPMREAQRMSDAKPRTSLRSYWHTRPKKKEQTPLKTRVRYNKTISVHLLTEPYVDVTAHTAPSQQAVGHYQRVEEWKYG